MAVFIRFVFYGNELKKASKNGTLVLHWPYFILHSHWDYRASKNLKSREVGKQHLVEPTQGESNLFRDEDETPLCSQSTEEETKEIKITEDDSKVRTGQRLNQTTSDSKVRTGQEASQMIMLCSTRRHYFAFFASSVLKTEPATFREGSRSCRHLIFPPPPPQEGDDSRGIPSSSAKGRKEKESPSVPNAAPTKDEIGTDSYI